MKRYEMKGEKEWKEMKNEKGNEIGDEGAKRISESIKINTSLTSLNLGCDEEIWNEKKREENKKKW